MNRKRIVKIVGVLLFIFVFGFMFSSEASALGLNKDAIFKRILVNNLPFCYKNALKYTVKDEDIDNFNSLMNDGYKYGESPKTSPIRIPEIDGKYNEITETLDDGGRVITCYALFNGDKKGGKSLDGKMKGLLQIYHGLATDQYYNRADDLRKKLMEDILDYEVEVESISGMVRRYDVQVEKGTAEGFVTVGSYSKSADSELDDKIVFDRTDEGSKEFSKIEGTIERDGSLEITLSHNTYYCGVTNYGTGHPCKVTVKISSPDENGEYKSYNIEDGWPGSTPVFRAVVYEEEGGEVRSGDKKYTQKLLLGSTGGSYVEKITDGEYSSQTEFSDADKYSLYIMYLETYYGFSEKPIGSGSTCQEDKPSKLVDTSEDKYYIWTKGKGWCLANFDPDKVNEEHAMSVFLNNDYVLDYVDHNLLMLIDTMGALDYSNEEEFPDIADDYLSDNEDGEDDDICYGNSGAIGWFICPIITAVSGIGEHMWDQIETYHLKFPAQEVFKPDNGVEQTWNIIKDIANTLFIVLLLFVIFSQLTGVGIDNYGIKKILPKLILVAVLVNLSYVICKLAVDFSNILGIGLNSMLSGAAGDLEIELDGTTANWTFDIGISGGGIFLFTILGGFPTLVATIAAIGLAVLGLIIVVAVAMLILYVILLIREVGIIIAIVVAPIAFVCYLLPNTEKLFKKWVDLFKALLLVYPICGAMVGAGRLAGVTLASIDNTNMRIAAMVVQVLPFLLIPKVLKGSLKMLGNLGAKISSIGQNLGRKTSSRAQGAIKGSDAYKRFQEDMANKKQERWANRVMNRLGGVDENKLTSRQKMKRSRAADILTSKIEREKRGERMGEAGFATAVAGINAKADAQRDADAEAMLIYGNAEYVDSNGRRVKVRPGDTKSVSAYHAASLKKYHNAKTEEEKARAFAELKAAQKRLSATDGGRGEVQRNLEEAVNGGYGDAAAAAAEHLQRDFGDIYKAKNRGANALIGDLAGGTSMEVVQGKINDDSYNLAGADKYDQSTLAGADDTALANMASAVARATDKHSTEVVKIRETARKALEMYDSGKLSINQRALEQIRNIVEADGGGQPGAGGGAATGDSGPTAEGDIFKVQNGKKEKIGTVKIKPKS